MNYKTTKERITLTGNMGLITTASGRTLEEMKAGIRIRMRNMVNNALEIGIDLMEVKEACRHGEWMPFLREIGISASSAANYMRIAKEVNADSAMARLPYTKILALLSAPAEEREELAAAAEDMSAAEIRRLTEERNRAAEAANTETMRADQAEADAKMFNQEAANLRNKVSVLQNELNGKTQYADDLRRVLDEKEEEMQRLLRKCDEEAREEEREKLQAEIDDLRGKLIVAENHQKIEVVPADYEQLKRERQELIEAAAEAETRAAEAEAALEEMQNENAQDGVSDFEKMHFALRSFLMQCEFMALTPGGLYRDAEKALKDVGRLRLWCDTLEKALSMQAAEGAVM